MGLRDFLCIPKRYRRTQSNTRSEIGPIQDEIEAGPTVVLRPTESAPDLGTGTSTLSAPSPLATHNQESNDRPPVPDRLSQTVLSESQGEKPGSSDPTVDSSAIDESKSKLGSLASSTAKLLLRGVNESADVFPPLKSVASGLCFILDTCEKTMACRHKIESLIPRVEGLAKSLGGPVPEGEIHEEERRKILERNLDKILKELASLQQQGKVTQFLKSTEDVDTLGGLVEDIRDAMMEYQTSLQQDIYNKSCQLIVSIWKNLRE